MLERPARKLTVYQLEAAAEGLGRDAAELLAAADAPSAVALLQGAREAAHGRRRATHHRPRRRWNPGREESAPASNGKSRTKLPLPPEPIRELQAAQRRVARQRLDPDDSPVSSAPSPRDAEASLMEGPIEHRRRDLRVMKKWRSVGAVRSAARALDELRYAEPWEAIELGQILTVEIASRLRGKAGVEAFATAAGVLGSAHRIAGSMEGAAFCLEAALEVGGWAQPRRWAELPQRAGTPLYSFARYEQALKLVQQAARIYNDEVDLVGIGQTWTDKSALYSCLEQPGKARECAEQALKLLPGPEKQHRASAYHELALLHRKARDFEAASEYLRRALELVPSNASHSRGMILWSRAEIAWDRWDVEEARHHLHQAIARLGRINPFDTALATLDLVEVLLASGETRGAIARADRMAGLLQPFHGNPIAAAAATHLSTLARRQALCLEAVEKARKAIEGGRSLGIRPPSWR